MHVVVSIPFQVINAGHFWAQKPDSESASKLQMLQENINMYDGRNLEVRSPSYCEACVTFDFNQSQAKQFCNS